MISSSSAYKSAANQLMTQKAWSGKPFGMLLVLLRCLLGGSWGLLGPLGSLLAPLVASWRPLRNLLGPLGGVLAPLGGLLGASWGGLRPILVPLERSLAHLGVVLKSFGWKSGPGCSGSTILGAPRWSPWRGNGPGSSGSRISRGPLGGAQVQE